MALLLDSLVIENFRGFRSLKIEGLGRVNLVVGKNNTGKTTFLEAIRIWASRADLELLLAMNKARDELLTASSSSGSHENTLTALQQLYNGRPRRWGMPSVIRIGPAGQQLTIEMNAETATLKVTVDGKEETRDTRERGSVGRRSQRDALAHHMFVPPGGVTNSEAAKLFAQIHLTDLEEKVIDMLRAISPDIEKMSFVGETTIERIPMVKIRGVANPIALRSLGDGVTRLLGIAIALVSARDGILLIDEVENGVHFSVQKQLWQLMFANVHQLNVQVFATTHSLDCIEAFHDAAAVDKNEEATLIRLAERHGEIVSFVLSEHELEIATRDQLEVR